MVKNPEQYWKDRYQKQGILTPGFYKSTDHEADYKRKKDFIRRYLPEFEVVLEFGCGVGKMAELFEGRYQGFDFPHVREFFPTDRFLFYDIDIFWKRKFSDWETLFTSCVLQHNTDEECQRILDHAKNVHQIILYEATEGKAKHCIGRSPIEYQKMVNRPMRCYSHKMHGLRHSLMIFK